ncbi:hypothetical protein [Salinimicrobium sp. GXAS 041]|uniref:hypothetical protein n=1 Tax=Salinimicrobium sp. GXAS 041 TaxID=3400806 RepID=UPI003C71B594
MADIDIEKKSGGSKWIWIILGLIILALLIWWFTADDDEPLEESEIEEVDTTTTETYEDTAEWDDTLSSGGVEGFIAHVGDKSRMGIDHEYTNDALIQLMNAVEAKANEENVNIDVELQEVRQQAQEITQDPMALDHADIIKNAGETLVSAMEKIQQEKYPDLSADIEEMRTAVQGIQPSVQTLEQKEQVNSFFDEAADALRKMS